MWQGTSVSASMSSEVQLLGAEEETAAALSMAKLAAERPLSAGPLSSSAPAVLRRAEAAGTLSHTSVDPETFAKCGSEASGMQAVQTLLHRAERPVRPMGEMPDDDSPKTSGRKRKAACASTGPPTPPKRRLPDSASPLEVAAEEARIRLLRSVAANKGKWSEVASLKGSISRLQAKAARLPTHMAAERHLNGVESYLVDVSNVHVQIMLVMAAQTSEWDACRLPQLTLDVEHALSTMTHLRAKVAISKECTAREGKRVAKLLSNIQVQEEARRKTECLLMDQWKVPRSWQSHVRDVEAVGTRRALCCFAPQRDQPGDCPPHDRIAGHVGPFWRQAADRRPLLIL